LLAVHVGNAVRIPREALQEYLTRKHKPPVEIRGASTPERRATRPRASRTRATSSVDWRAVLGLT
jgi:hypothetical protein